MIDFCVLGSGVAGSTIANLLSKKYSVHVFDKARGPGGRSSNKRFKDKLSFDHGVQYISPKSKEFIKLKEPKKIKKVILCSGKVYFDLIEAREKMKKDDVVIYRIEQLYPFPAKSLVKEIRKYAETAKFFWCQEEPKNMGAWFSVRDYIPVSYTHLTLPTILRV